ncbi:hypothetical protein [Stenotrophomonas sp.]|uniref:hypothetical protein n=1 Tax=Stenotrophomonas sp. TaxID=69392 RepID=UPI0028B0F1B8|nr:hypothetical protein [Stenotrophomonas sp.]
MTTTRHEHVGFKFFPPGMYLSLEGSEVAMVYTDLPEDAQGVSFDFTVNGEPGPHPGIIFTMTQARYGILEFHRYFTQNYHGSWPINLEVRCLKDGHPVDLGLMQLRDPRSAVAHSMKVEHPPEVTIPKDTDRTSAHFAATFFDKDHYPLPRSTDWELELIEPAPGVIVSHNLVYVYGYAQPGEVAVKVSSAKYGIDQTVALKIVGAPSDHIGIKFFPPAIYPSLVDSETVLIYTQLPSEIQEPEFEYSVNNVLGPHPDIGFGMPTSSGWMRFYSTFAENYQGPWPAIVEVRYLKGGKPVDLGILQLRDPNNAIAAFMRLTYTHTVEIPSDPDRTSNHVFAEFFDKDHVILPFRPRDWEVILIDPPAGVSADGNFIYVYPLAQPGEVRFKVRSEMHDLEELGSFQLVAAGR